MKTVVTASTLRVSVLAESMRKNKIYLDEAFQSNTRWGTKAKQAFMKSLIEGRAVGAITLGHIPSLKNAILLASSDADEDYRYFLELEEQGYEYITIDGNNRDHCILDYMNDVFPLAEGSYESGIGFKATKNNKFYSELNHNIKFEIDTTKLNIHVVRECTREGLSKLFTSINEGMQLNDQEKRNAIACKFGNAVRKLVSECDAGFAKMYSASNINRRFPDEYIVTVANLVAQGMITVTKNVRDDAYGDSTPEMNTFNRTRDIIKRVTGIVARHGKEGLKSGGKFKSNVIDLAILLDYMNSNNIVIEDELAFYNFFTLTQEQRISDDTILWTNKKGTDCRAWIGIQKNLQKNFLMIRQEKLVESLKEIADGVVTFRDTDRFYDPKVRYSLWKRQEGRCALTGKDIAPIDIWNGNVIHVDHKEAWAKGGETTLENAQLVYAEANLIKGMKDTIDQGLPELSEIV